MKSFDSRTYSINDFVEWDKQGALELNPRFQRRSVWSPNAKSFLMDTILRGKPMPKLFIRQKINVTKKTSIREVVDGQQRLRTILSFIKDGFEVSKRHNSEYGGVFFSRLPEEVQAQVLSYEVAVDLLINLPDAEVLDIFGRLNSYAIILNEQERIHADHFGTFKILADEIGRKYNDYWTKQGIMTARQILRMQEVNLVADLLIAMREGIRSKKRIKGYYDIYEKDGAYDDDPKITGEQFNKVIESIGFLYPEGLSDSEFSRNHLFYSLFTAIAHCLYGLKGQAGPRLLLATDAQIGAARNNLDRVEEMFSQAASDLASLSGGEREFIQDSRRATTDETVRKRRTTFLLGLMSRG
jgi:Protein of unknown function DUF262